MDKEKALSRIQWIKTPYTYTGLNKNMSLLQQNILIKVSAYMQKFWDNYWNSNLKDAKETPKPFLSPEDLLRMEPIHLTMDDLGVENGNYTRANAALKDILHLTVDVPYNTKKGTEIRKYNIFAYGGIPVKGDGEAIDIQDDTTIYIDRERGCIDLQLNPYVVNYVFDMRQGYVSHPEDIARIGKQESMPILYYLIKHHMNNWKKTSARIDFFEIKDTLGMIHRNEEGFIDSVSYPKYAHFRDRVLKKAMDEMHKLYLKGKLDKDFDWTEERDNGKKTGDPKSIVFTIKETPKITEIQNSQSDQPETKRSWVDSYIEQHGNPTTQLGQKAWDSLCSQIQSEEKRNVFLSVRVEKIDHKSLILYGDRSAVDAFDALFKSELDDGMRTWVFSTVTRLAEREVKYIKYHTVS